MLSKFDCTLNICVHLYLKMTRKIESQRFLFTSSRISTEKPLGQQMDHSAIANAMASSFKKTKVFGNRTEKVPCSRIRMSFITEPVSLEAEHLSSIANCFAKHSEKVCKKYYVRHFSEREAARLLLWECYQRYTPNQDPVKAGKMRSAAIKKCHVADTGMIETWIKELVAKIKLVSHDSNVVDANLQKELNKLSREQGY